MNRYPTEDRAAEESLSHTVIENVAGHKGTEALMLDPPLYEVLDPDSLDALFTGRDDPSRDVQITFEYCGCSVTVSSDGHVLVEDIEDGSAGEPTTA